MSWKVCFSLAIVLTVSTSATIESAYAALKIKAQGTKSVLVPGEEDTLTITLVCLSATSWVGGDFTLSTGGNSLLMEGTVNPDFNPAWSFWFPFPEPGSFARRYTGGPSGTANLLPGQEVLLGTIVIRAGSSTGSFSTGMSEVLQLDGSFDLINTTVENWNYTVGGVLLSATGSISEGCIGGDHLSLVLFNNTEEAIFPSVQFTIYAGGGNSFSSASSSFGTWQIGENNGWVFTGNLPSPLAPNSSVLLGNIYINYVSEGSNQTSFSDVSIEDGGVLPHAVQNWSYDIFCNYCVCIAQYIYHANWSGSGTPPWNAIDLGKSLAIEGSVPVTLSYDNLINSSHGIRGLVFDLQDLASVALTPNDFRFQMSPKGSFDPASNPPLNWQDTPSPNSIIVSPGNPARVLVLWPGNTIENRWLRATIKATSSTGLEAPVTYYIGHLLGETTGPTNGVFTVAFSDISEIRNRVGVTVDASSIADIDKNGTVSFSDISTMRPSVGLQLSNITIPAIGN